MNAVANLEKNNEIQTFGDNPQSLLTIAIQNGTNVEQLEKLLLLKERWDAAQAKKSFLAAISRFQSQIPVIQKKKQVGYTGKSGQLVGYKYAELSEIDDAIKGPMLDNGLSKRWELGEDAENIICTCIISHVDGHSEKTTLSSTRDDSGNKNNIQSRASAVTYLQRYTLIGALGLTTASEDNDGDGTPQTPPQPVYVDHSKEMPWLNINDKKGNKTAEGAKIVADIAAGKISIQQLREQYKISKAVSDELQKIKVTGIEDIDHENVPPVYPPETKKENVVGRRVAEPTDEEKEAIELWRQKITGCKTIDELAKVFAEGKGMINSTPSLYALKEKKKIELQ